MATINVPIDLMSLPYPMRRLIHVDEYSAVVKARAIANLRADPTYAFFENLLNPTRLILGMPIDLLRKFYSAPANSPPILLLAEDEARGLKFAPGHPRPGVLYAAHPCMAAYYTMAEFHRKVFEHKLSEAVRLLGSLGATSMQVELVRGWGIDFASRISVQIPQYEVGAEAGYREKSSSKILFKANLRGSENPTVPEGLSWFDHEPTWASVAESRIQYGLKDFSLGVAYEDDLGVNAGLKAAIEGIGLSVGGAYEEHQSTVWRISGEFLSAGQ